MATTIVMPQLSSTMEKGTVVQWLKQVGDEVTEGEAIMEITTDKVDIEVESPASGVLLKVLVDTGDEVPVKEPIAVLGEAGEEVGDVSAIAESAPPAAAEAEAEPVQEKPAPPKGKIFASPRARRLAKESGVDLAAVTGTGPRGRIVSQDIRKYIKGGKPPVAIAKPAVMPGQVVKLTGIQRTVAGFMLLSMSEKDIDSVVLFILLGVAFIFITLGSFRKGELWAWWCLFVVGFTPPIYCLIAHGVSWWPIVGIVFLLPGLIIPLKPFFGKKAV